MRSRNSKPVVAISVVLAAVAMAQTNSPAQPEKPATVEGKITNSLTGEPILRAHVTLGAEGSSQSYGALTEADGKYNITNLPAGEYILRAQRTGFVDSAALEISNTTVKVAAGDSRTEQNLKLVPQGSITGRILTPDGDAMEGVQVSVVANSQPSNPATSDDKGAFRIGGLAPGKYRVRARTVNLPFPPEIRSDGTTEAHYSQTYYPGVPNEKQAARVEVAAGAETNGVEIRLLRAPILKIGGIVSGIPEKAANVFVSVSGDGGNSGSRVKPDGTFEIWSVDAGKYRLMANRRDGGQTMRSAPIEVEVATQNVEHVELRIVPLATITGQVEYDDDGAKPTPPKPDTGQDPKSPKRPGIQRVLLRSSDRSGDNKVAPISPDGAFTFEDVQPDLYTVSVTWSPAFVKSVRVNGKESDGANIDVRTGVASGLAIRVSSKVAEISGTVKDDKGPVAGARVFAALEDQLNKGQPLMTLTDANGAYSITGIPPGKYRMLAADRSDTRFTRPGVDEEYAEAADKVEFHAGDKQTRDLKLYTGAK